MTSKIAEMVQKLKQDKEASERGGSALESSRIQSEARPSEVQPSPQPVQQQSWGLPPPAQQQVPVGNMVQQAMKPLQQMAIPCQHLVCSILLPTMLCGNCGEAVFVPEIEAWIPCDLSLVQSLQRQASK